MGRVVAIHQPNFFPWLGYFDKIRRSDVFIFLDAVDYPRSGSGGMGSWTNRVKLSIQGQSRWVTCPVRRVPLGSSILSVSIDDKQPWRSKLLKTLDANYRKASWYDRALSTLRPLIEYHSTNLSDFNINAIRSISEELGLSSEFVRQSDLSFKGSATDLLISLVREVDGDTYLAGGGAGGYQEDALFPLNNVELIYQNFEDTIYGPKESFINGLSVIDFMMNDERSLVEFFGR